MRRLFAATLFAQAICSAQSPNITGTWIGVATEPGVTTASTQTVLTEDASGNVTGQVTSVFTLLGTQYTQRSTLAGHFANSIYTYQGQTPVATPPLPAGYFSCTGSGTLTFSATSNGAMLSGPWQAPGCPGGIITMTRNTTINTTNGVINGASFQNGLSSNSWITIVGTNLSTTTRTWQNSDFSGNSLPTSLDGVRVTVNGKPAYIAYISPGQINALAPGDASLGPVIVQVFNGTVSSNSVSVNKQAVAPALFTYGANQRYALAQDSASYALLAPPGLYGSAVTTRAAVPGELITLYATGLGATNPVYPEGTIITTAVPLASQIQVLVGNVAASVQFVGLTAPGLYQINLVVPSVPSGDASVSMIVGGVQSPSQVFIPIR